MMSEAVRLSENKKGKPIQLLLVLSMIAVRITGTTIDEAVCVIPKRPKNWNAMNRGIIT